MTSLSAQIRDYDICFAEFLKPSGNGQKIMQAILLREAFRRFAQQEVGRKQDAPTAILDVSCGPGDYSVAWTSDIANFLPKGMIFYCTDYPGGISRETGEKYTATTSGKIWAAAQNGQLLLAQPPVAIDADLFSGEDRLMPAGKLADIVHWSHSGSLLVGSTADSWGRKPLFLAGFAILPIRAVLYTFSDNSFWLIGVQLLDGVGAGFFGALTPLVIADIMHGTGRYNPAVLRITAVKPRAPRGGRRWVRPRLAKMPR